MSDNKIIVNLLLTQDEWEIIKKAAETMEIKGKGTAVRALALQRAKEILKEQKD